MKRALTLLYMTEEQKGFRATVESGQSPDLPPLGALWQLGLDTNIHNSIYLHNEHGTICFSLFRLPATTQ